MRDVREQDFQSINAWYDERDLDPLSRDLYPPDGKIVDNVAAGFLTTTSSKVAFVENLITNPRALVEDRERAILEIIKALESLAVSRGFKYLVAISQTSGIDAYCQRMGGKQIKVKMFGKEL